MWFIFEINAPVALMLIFGAIAATGRGESTDNAQEPEK